MHCVHFFVLTTWCNAGGGRSLYKSWSLFNIFLCRLSFNWSPFLCRALGVHTNQPRESSELRQKSSGKEKHSSDIFCSPNADTRFQIAASVKWCLWQHWGCAGHPDGQHSTQAPPTCSLRLLSHIPKPLHWPCSRWYSEKCFFFYPGASLCTCFSLLPQQGEKQDGRMVHDPTNSI